MKRFCTLLFALSAIFLVVIAGGLLNSSFEQRTQESSWTARTFHYVQPLVSYASSGYTPDQMKTAYNLPAGGGAGSTIAIVVAYKATNIQSDLSTFSDRFGLPAPTSDNFEIHPMTSNLGTDTGWSKETALDVEWAHAIAPDAKILLVQARSPSSTDLMSAVDYARSRPEVTAVSMSWGNDETFSQTSWDYHFTSNYGAVFFASSGDSGSGAIWPASSPNVVGVGGTTLTLSSDGIVISETGWSGSGGGPSAYEAKPAYQTNYGINGTKRSTPDVSYNANPSTGIQVCVNSVWYIMGGTSAGAPQWAAIQALGRSATNGNFYLRAKSQNNATFFRDITSGSNGVYNAGSGYDYVTGLGSPLTTNFSNTTAPVPNSITLLPAENSTILSSSNRFMVNYTLNEKQFSTYVQDGTSTLNTDENTNLTISGISNGSTSQEKWVINANGDPVSGANLTLYYYDIFVQTMNYSVMGGGTPTSPVITYSTAPSLSSAQQTTQLNNSQLMTSPTIIWPVAGTNVSVPKALSPNSLEQWSTPTTDWLIAYANQIPNQINYFHQYNASIGYQIIGGGNPTPPTINAKSYGATLTLSPLQSNIVSLWLDAGSQFQLSNNLSSSNPNERWTSNYTTGTVDAALNTTITYYHQFNVAVQYSIIGGGNPESPIFNFSSFGTILNQQLSTNPMALWVDSNTLYNVPIQLNGSTATERWYTVSNSGNIQNATTQNFTYNHQFLLNASRATIASQWYNSNESAQVFLNGVSGRNSLTGSAERLVSYSIDNDAPIEVQPTTGLVPLSIMMNSTHLLSTNSITQYQVNTSTGSLNSITPAPINGDNGWYDNGTTITINYDYSWNTIQDQSRLNAVSYSLRSGTSTAIIRSGTGIFTVQLKLTNPETVNVASVTQYLVNVSGGNNVAFSQPSPTKDSFFDSDSPISVSSDRTWAISNGNTRQILVGYTANSISSAINKADVGSYSFQLQGLNSPLQLTFNSVTQYLIAFQFKDNSGTETIIPTYFQLRTNGSELIEAPNQNVWLDGGTQFQIQSIIWQNAEVKPENQPTYFVIAPITNTILCTVYTGKILIQSNQGSPLPEVQVTVTLANETTIQVTTGSEGTALLSLVPQGTFSANAAYMGENTTLSGDFSKQAVATGTIQLAQAQSSSPSPSSYPSPSIPELSSTIVTVTLLVSGFAVALFVRKEKR